MVGQLDFSINKIHIFKLKGFYLLSINLILPLIKSIL